MTINKIDHNAFANSAAISKQAFDMPRIGGHVAESAQKATEALLAMRIPVDGEQAETVPGADLAKPMLAPPAVPLAKGMNGGAALLQLLGELVAMLGESGVNELESRLAIFKDKAKAREKALTEVSKQLEQSVKLTGLAAKIYKAAKGETAAARGRADSAREKADAAELALTSAAADDPSRPKLQLQHEAAQQSLHAAARKLDAALENESIVSADLMQKLKISTDIETQAGALGAKPNVPEMSSSVARLSLLMSELSKIIGDGRDANMENDRELFKEMQAKRQLAMEKSANDYDAEVAKADQTSKTMGCIGKVIGYLVLAISIIAVPFTGGASLALAVLAIGLTAADAITSAVTGGKSLTDMAMGPIMTGVVQPMIDLLTKEVTKLLVAVGVPKEKAEMIAGIIAAVVVAIAMVVLMVGVAVVAKGPMAGKLASKMGGVISKAIARAMQSTVGQGVKTFTRPLAQAVSRQGSALSGKLSALTTPETINTVSRTAQYTGAALTTGNAATQAGGSVAHGIFVKNAANAESDLVLSQTVLKQLTKLMSKASEKYAEIKNTEQSLIAMASDTMLQSTRNTRAIGNRLRG